MLASAFNYLEIIVYFISLKMQLELLPKYTLKSSLAFQNPLKYDL